MTERRLWVQGFQVAIWVTVAVIVVFSPLLLIGLGWFLETYEEVEGAAPVSHRVHEISFGILFALALVGALTQRREPGQNIAGMQQLVVVTVVFTVVMWRAIDRFEWLSVVYLLPVVVAAVLHPQRKRLLWPPPRPFGAGLAMTAIALLPLVDAAGRELERAANQAQDHTTHWGGMAAFFLTLLFLSLVASLRPPGHRITAVGIGGAIILYGVASLFFSFDASSHPSAWAVLAIAWGIGWIALAAWFPEIRERKAREPSAMRTALTALGAFMAVILGLAVSFIWMGGDAPANIPHAIDVSEARPATCQSCHGTGKNGAPDVPHDFPRDGQTTCLACHAYDPALLEVVADRGQSFALPFASDPLTDDQLEEVSGK
ncbi:MAG: hypothetical protein ACE5MI_13410 [Acidimicrobiia bacterium]